MSDLRTYWPLWLVVAAAILLRLYEVHRLPGMQGDEAWYGLQARLWLGGEEVRWRTPNGNVPGMTQMWSLILLHWLFHPSLLLLRVPTILSSIAAIGLAYAIGRRFLGPSAGVVAAVLMACFPITIGYARLGWDPSHSSLLVLAAVYASFAGRTLLSALLFTLAITNHPSAVFTAPFLALGFLGFGIVRQGRPAAFLHSAAQVALLMLAILLEMALSPNTAHYVSLSRTVDRLLDPAAWLGFGQMFGRLLSGDTLYAYVFGAGMGAARHWADWAVSIGLLAVLVAGGSALRKQWDWRTAGMLAGWLCSLALLYLIAGLWVMSPTFERFAFPMVALTALTIGAIYAPLVDRHRIWAQLLLAAAASSLLLGFWTHYVRPLQNGGSRPVKGFWTAGQDPNFLAYDRIARDSKQAGGAQIIAEDWWLQIPIEYYAVGEPIEVISASAARECPDGAAIRYWAVYGGGTLDRALGRATGATPAWTIATTNADNDLHIWRTRCRR